MIKQKQGAYTHEIDLANPPVYLREAHRYLEGNKISDRTGCETDSRRQKLYDAERAICDSHVLRLGDRFDTVDEMQSYVDHMIDLQWFRRRWGRSYWVSRKWFDYELIVKDGRGRRKACFTESRESVGYFSTTKPAIKMPRWSRSEIVILHEVAHALVPKPHAWHGRLFARTYLELVRWRMGDDVYERLRDSFRDHNVKWHPKRS